MVRILFFLFFFLSSLSYGGERVVSLAPSLSEVIYYLGKDSELVGVTDFCDAPFCRDKERVGGIVNPSVEKVVSLRPTVVFCTTMTPERVCEALKRLGIKVYRLRLISLEDLYSAVDFLSLRLGAPPKGRELRRELEGEAEWLGGCLGGKRGVVVLSVKPLYCAGSSTYLGELLALSGAKVVPEGGFKAVSLEFLMALRPDLVFSFAGCREFKGFRCVDLSPYKSDLLHPSPRLLKGLLELKEELCSR